MSMTQSTNCPKACRKNQTSRKKRKEKKRKEKYSLNFHHPYPFKIPVGFDKLSNPGNSNLGELPKCFIFKRNV
jgi:hypothetical protein